MISITLSLKLFRKVDVSPYLVVDELGVAEVAVPRGIEPFDLGIASMVDLWWCSHHPW
jgi:hypothetical protein